MMIVVSAVICACASSRVLAVTARVDVGDETHACTDPWRCVTCVRRDRVVLLGGDG